MARRDVEQALDLLVRVEARRAARSACRGALAQLFAVDAGVDLGHVRLRGRRGTTFQ